MTEIVDRATDHDLRRCERWNNLFDDRQQAYNPSRPCTCMPDPRFAPRSEREVKDGESS